MDGAERLVCFAHGKESGPWSRKIVRLSDVARDLGYAVESPDYRFTMNPDARRHHLEALRPVATQSLVLVGSSMGGYVSALAASVLRPQGLFLMAPALYLPGYPDEPDSCPDPTVVVHGWHDDLVPVANAIRFAQRHAAMLHVLDAGHTLTERLDELTQLFELFLKKIR